VKDKPALPRSYHSKRITTSFGLFRCEKGDFPWSLLLSGWLQGNRTDLFLKKIEQGEMTKIFIAFNSLPESTSNFPNPYLILFSHLNEAPRSG